LIGVAPDTGWHIGSWFGTNNDSTTASTNMVTMPASAHAAGVNYAQDEYLLTVNVEGSGSVAREPDQATYHYGDVVTLTATADAGWSFAEWGGDLSGSDNPVTITMNGDRTVTASFVSTSGTLGDVNRDGSVNSTDALIILSCDAGIDTSGFCPMNCGDVNGDGLVNSTDALIILSFDAGIEVPYPVGEPGCPSSVTPCPGCVP
jgi:hypothetical protein